MSLRTRLFVILGVLFLVPIVAGGLLLAFVVPDIRNDRVRDSVVTASASVQVQIGAQCTTLSLAAATVALASQASPAAQLFAPVRDTGITYAALLGPSGQVRRTFGELPTGLAPGDLQDCGLGRADGAVLSRTVDVQVTGGGAAAGQAVAAQVLDTPLMAKLAQQSGADNVVLLIAGGEVVASNTDADTARTVVSAAGGRTGAMSVDGWAASVRRPSAGSPFTVVVASQQKGIGAESLTVFLAVLVLGGLFAAALVASVARSLSQPFTDLTKMAERVAEGDLDARLDSVGAGEAGRLGEAFNRMTGELRKNMSALEQSRDDLQKNLNRIGDTLAKTHDLDGLLRVVLESAVATLRAEAGVVLYGPPGELRVVAERGFAKAGLVLPEHVTPGAGVLGQVLSTGKPRRGVVGSGALQPVPGEPDRGAVLATPLHSAGAVAGVVALYGRVDGKPFDDTDQRALTTLSSQAKLAIDNVQRHQEAERLSTTDGLTGLWNFRYLSMSLAREIERSTRFDRPLAVLMLDLDHFKNVNDSYGHARGDSVLRELANRVQEQIREVDTFARYGGEEFVVVLPETTIEGAAQLAERICFGVRREQFHTDGEPPLRVTVSIGVAAFPQHGSSAATLMRAADRALYVAKHEGRDRWHVAGEGATASIGH